MQLSIWRKQTILENETKQHSPYSFKNIVTNSDRLFKLLRWKVGNAGVNISKL